MLSDLCQIVLKVTCAGEKALILSGGEVPPGNWFAPPGGNRSSGGGNEAMKPLMKRVALGDPASMQAVTKVNVEQASKRIMQELTRRHFGESRMPMGKYERTSLLVLPGY